MLGRRPTPWGRLRTLLLVALLLLPGTPEVLSRLSAEQAARDRALAALAALAPGRNTLPEHRERHQAAPPAPSGAFPPYPLNHTFDAELVTLGTPTNHDVESAATDVGTPPANFDFATGSFADWTTTTTTPTIGSDATQGSYASLQATTIIETTTAFTLDPGMQVVTFRVTSLSASSDKAIIDLLSGPTFSTVTQAWSGTAGDSG